MQYGEVTKNSNEVDTAIENGEVTLEYGNAEQETEFIDGTIYRSNLSLKNNTNKELENIVLQINKPEEFKIVSINYPEGDDYKSAENATELTIKSLGAGKKIDIGVVARVELKKDEENIPGTIFFNAKVGNNEYKSNQLDISMKKAPVIFNLVVKSDDTDKTLNPEDYITYNITIKNISESEQEYVALEDTLSENVMLDEVTRNEIKLEEATEDDDSNADTVKYRMVSRNEDNIPNTIKIEEETIKAGETINYTIKVKIKNIYNQGSIAQILNKTEVIHEDKTVLSIETRHTAKTAEYEEPENNNDDNDDNNDSEDNTDDNNTDEDSKSYVISGTAWIDSNEDGKIDSNERKLSGVNVKLLNAETNEYVKDEKNKMIGTTTNEEGFYALNNVPKGEYLVVFEYDTKLYKTTEVIKDETNTSKAIEKDLTIDNNTQKYGVTEKINLNKDATGINIGLIEKEKYDMQLDKYVSKITVQNSKTTTTNYENEKLAKQEIKAKEINSSIVIVEYTIKITNNGDVAGYVKKIADYLSSDYEFKADLNKDWYKEGNNVYSTSLADKKINPGESKEIKLTVVKHMNNSNMGLITNTAEIVDSYNEEGLKDYNSTEGNKAEGENDMSSANVIIAVKTGEIIVRNTLIVITIGMFAILIIMIIKKRKENR